MIVSVTNMEFMKASVTMLSRADTYVVRAEYTEQLRRDFRNFALRIMMSNAMSGGAEGLIPMDEFDDLQIHHIAPLSLGGSNRFSNLTLIDRELHKEVHREIEIQTSGMRHLDTRVIDLPFFSGMIWRLDALRQ